MSRAAVLVEREIFTDSHGQKIERAGDITCVYYNSIHGACSRTLPLEQGQAWHMMPTHDCSRPSEIAPWSCQPRAGGGLTPEEQALLLMWMNGGQAPANPGLEAGRNNRSRNCGLLYAAASTPSHLRLGMERFRFQHSL